MSTSFWDRDRADSPPTRTRVPGGETDVVVVGGGLTGLTTALLLSRAGKRVVVLEATRPGALASGTNTGKATLLQGTTFSQLLDRHPVKVAQAYVAANREGVAWLERFCADHGVDHQHRTAITYAGTPEDVDAVAAEQRAAHRLGVPVTWEATLDVPFAVHGAILLPDQLQLDPLQLVEALAAEVERHGGTVAEHSRVVDVSWGRHPRARTEDGREFRGDRLVLATGSPVLDRGLYFAKLEARRSYLLAYRTTNATAPLPGMMIGAGQQPRSLRDVPDDVLLVGGAGHVVGRGGPELAGLEELRTWAAEHFPGAAETHAWSAQDYTSHDGIPYVGGLPRGLGHIDVATGYNKWGLANAVAAALRLAGAALGSAPAWARPLERRVTRPASAWNVVRRNAEVGLVAARRLAGATATPVSPQLPAATGEVGRAGLDPRPIGVVEAGCAVRAICTHLGGTLRWNDAERSWDCPLHGSRFAEDGAVIEGPAVRPLEQLPE